MFPSTTTDHISRKPHAYASPDSAGVRRELGKLGLDAVVQGRSQRSRWFPKRYEPARTTRAECCERNLHIASLGHGEQAHTPPHRDADLDKSPYTRCHGLDGWRRRWFGRLPGRSELPTGTRSVGPRNRRRATLWLSNPIHPRSVGIPVLSQAWVIPDERPISQRSASLASATLP